MLTAAILPNGQFSAFRELRVKSMALPKSTSIRPGPLAEAIEIRLAKTGETLSQYIRRLVAADLGKPVPDMLEGNPAFRKAKKPPQKRKAK